MLTIAIPNRNRNLATVKRTLQSIVTDNNDQIHIVVVDYGSAPQYQSQLTNLIEEIENCKLMLCPTQGQLWQKTRAINIALQNCGSPYFMVADMDMIFHPQFVKKALAMTSPETSLYFQVGIMTEEESQCHKEFEDYHIKFKTNEQATGITLFPTQVLKSIQGFDEFYHGWGAEDTDVHVRLKNAGYQVNFYDQECFFLHQWHPKLYRSKKSLDPYHPKLEKINHEYLKLAVEHKHTKVNKNLPWGVFPDKDEYAKLEFPSTILQLSNTQREIDAFIFKCYEDHFRGVFQIEIEPDPKRKGIKEKFKRVRKTNKFNYLGLDIINQKILGLLISKLRNLPYNYKYAPLEGKIVLRINFNEK